MDKYEMLPKSVIDELCRRLQETITDMRGERTMDKKCTCISNLEGCINGIQTERCQCNVVPFQIAEQE